MAQDLSDQLAPAGAPVDVRSVGRAYHQKRQVKIIVDSTADYAPGVAEQLGVEVIPFTYVGPDGEHVDDLWATSDPHEFYEGMRKNPHVRYTTSAVTPGRYLEVFERAAEEGLPTIYMGLTAGTPMRDIKVDTVFLGSCTNGRIEDLRAAAAIVKGRKKADSVRMLVVPGSARVRLQAEAEGLDAIFTEFGAEWRNAGCSMCLAMNPDKLAPGERSASTSNRNFEGRQGKGGRTHLVSPLVAAATAVRGTLSSPADL